MAAAFIAHLPGYCQGASEPDYTARKLQTYTFAAPRIGDRILSKYFSGDTLNYKAVQVKNQSDVVPYVPPASECVPEGLELLHSCRFSCSKLKHVKNES